MVFIGSEMETAVATLGETAFLSLPLGKQLFERDFTCCKNPKIPVQRKNILIGVQRKCSSNRNGFLANAAEPFADLALAKEYQHLILNDARIKEVFIDIKQVVAA